MPQSLWWITATSRVPSSRCETTSDRITSSVTAPPALRITCASPGRSPSAANTSMHASMQVTMATPRVGVPCWLPGYALAANLWLLCTSCSMRHDPPVAGRSPADWDMSTSLADLSANDELRPSRTRHRGHRSGTGYRRTTSYREGCARPAISAVALRKSGSSIACWNALWLGHAAMFTKRNSASGVRLRCNLVPR
jgi:hypothetical protein